MNVFYANVWGEWGCAGAGYAVACVALAIFAALLGAFWLLFVRKGRAGAWAVKAVLLSSAVIMVATLGVALLTGSTLHRAELASDHILLDYCDGLHERREIIRLEDVAVIEHRLVRGYRPSDPSYDRLAIRLRSGEERLVPLETDPEVSPPEALAELLTPEALANWRASLQRRGRAAPAGLVGRD